MSLDAALIDGATAAADAVCQRVAATGMVRIAGARIKAFNTCKTCKKVGIDAFVKAQQYYDGTIGP